MALDDDYGCPTCGSQHCRRLSGPGEQSSDVDNLDVENSGTFECLHCKDEYYVEVPLKSAMSQLPFFSPTARCPTCKSYNTRTRAVDPRKKRRNHECGACYHIWHTHAVDRD